MLAEVIPEHASSPLQQFGPMKAKVPKIPEVMDVEIDVQRHVGMRECQLKSVPHLLHMNMQELCCSYLCLSQWSLYDDSKY